MISQIDRILVSQLGIMLKSGGSLSSALSDTLKESAMYKNIVKESIGFVFKLAGWSLLNIILYNGAILTAEALQRRNFFEPFI